MSFYSISNLKLQKLLYFVQAYFLSITSTHEPCFGERIEAWNFGPVVPEAYHEYKQYGGGDIPSIHSYRDNDAQPWDTDRSVFEANRIKKGDRELINAVVDMFSDYTATDLVTITHNQTPWIEAYEPHENNEITIDAMRRYFNA
ncbi:hypothetical protein CE91St41_39770 [Oscillospiraceae bacterium]|nr:hypothetical protein CE91St40_39740 [Oscillospiraceae bacterium]BDF77088.1 hypothetical protein CE91St41_39770 [Oscillospiraceae bacterium]